MVIRRLVHEKTGPIRWLKSQPFESDSLMLEADKFLFESLPHFSCG